MAVSISLVFTVLLIAGVIAIGVGALLILLRMLVRRPMQSQS